MSLGLACRAEHPPPRDAGLPRPGGDEHALGLRRRGPVHGAVVWGTDIIQREASSCTLTQLVSKLIPEVIGREIEKSTQGIYPLQNVCFIWRTSPPKITNC